jgi:hypothetical protein
VFESRLIEESTGTTVKSVRSCVFATQGLKMHVIKRSWWRTSDKVIHTTAHCFEVTPRSHQQCILRFGTPEAHFAFWYTGSAFIYNSMLCVPCSIALQRQLQCVLCGAHVGFIEHASNYMCRQLDRNGCRRWILNFCCTHIQMMLCTI